VSVTATATVVPAPPTAGVDGDGQLDATPGVRGAIAQTA